MVPGVVPRPTLADVAAEARVSVSTASLAFSGAGPIASATRERVLAAASRLAYAGPNPLGQQLRSGRSGIVGVVVGDRLRRSFRDPVSTQMLDGLAQALSEQSLGLLLVPSEAGEVPPLVHHAAMDAAVVVLANGPDDDVVLALTRRGIPVVSVEGEIGDDPGRPGAATANVGIDDRGGTACWSASCCALGHRRFGVVSLPLRPRPAPRSAGRRRRGRGPGTPTRDAGWPASRTPASSPRSSSRPPASLVEHGRSAGHQILAGPTRRRPSSR